MSRGADYKQRRTRMNHLTHGDNLHVLRDAIARAEHPDYEPDLNFIKAKTEAHGEQAELL